MGYSVVVHPKPTQSASDRGTTFFASINGGKDFKIGTCLYYRAEDRYGLSNYETFFPYDPNLYADKIGFLAQFIDPTAYCESQRAFECVNSYDRAMFTFGAFQFAAHVADGDFVRWMHQMLALPDAGTNFPDLKLQDNRIFAKSGNDWIQLENKKSSAKLMDYFNSSSAGIEPAEAERTARMIYWARSSPDSRELQVQVMVETAIGLLMQVNRVVPLTGQPDFVCCAAMDIRHQGRGTPKAIASAIGAGGGSNAILDRLLTIGDSHRSAQLSDQIKNKRRADIFGKFKFSAKTRAFVPIDS